ncbi:TATA box-binding protein-associated factor RNA polymerase I subunit B [Chanos chanos]|uniref:TATA box-binding protein-associated factor RNA polymerase I subunit B n=1 Tax=Chanos chanos TaxID=29144 RepID=A0A6J2V7Y5_CHACN|nr:TATA box-binding protein-associated factor RNA polymerase I subunit B [Chanos chanos]
MDEELTAGYNEPCVQCSAVHWGISDGGQFFCKNCHNVIERIRDDVDEFFVTRSARASRIASRRQKKGKTGREWLVCEGFQFILKHQAEALVSLGVDPLFKSKVLINLWRRYLQKTRQAYTHQPIRTAKFCTDMTSESEGESVGTRSERSGPVSDNSESMRSEWSEPLSDASEGFDSASGLSSVGVSSVWSGSLDADMYISSKERKAHHLMSMPRTLALCHLALLWMREAITLSALLRLVYDDRVPYINAYKVFPEEMKPYGRDFGIFRVESLPSYRKVHKEAVEMAEILELPSFPPISEECLLHPTLLTVHYLQELNLPDELHVWVCKIIEKSRIKEESFLTFDPTIRNPTLPFYDLQAAAAIIVALKLLYGLNDRTEWIVSTIAERKRRDKKKKKGVEDKKIFSLRKWYKIVQPAVTQAKEREERALARKQWKSIKVIVPSLKAKSVVLKRRRK